MANENNEISDIVKKCKILLLDIEGTTTSISFVKDKLFPYAEEHVKEFLDNKWEDDDVKDAVAALRKLAVEDKEKSVEGVVEIPGEDASKEDQIEGLVNNVKWQMSSDRKAGPLKQLQGLIWKQGYDKGDIKGHVYDDVLPALEQWRSVEGQKIYIYSSGSVQAQKLLFGMSSSGDMLPQIDGHFDTAVGPKQEETSYKAIAEKIGCKLDEILFLTDIVKEAEAARAAGMCAALVSRSGNAPLTDEATAAFPVLHSLAQLTHTNKRKPDTQDEQPAKVPKTETEGDVKTVTEEAAVKTPENTESSKEPEPEKMDVEMEEKPAQAEESKKDAAPEASAPVETVIEEITDVTKIADTPAVETTPVVEEIEDKTIEKEIEMMETDPVEKEAAAKEKNTETTDKVEDKKVEEMAPIAEETPPTVVTEIEEISDDKQSLSEVAEIIEDLEPVVEEPVAAEDIEKLKNVGEVLEKECDEILSKVQDVTNLDNIPLKPLLNPIAEETMETENIDSNDIVDKILDTEMELGMKPGGDIPVDTVAEAETKNGTEDKTKKTELEAEPAKDDKLTETAVEVSKEEAKTAESACSMDTDTDKVNDKVDEVSAPKEESQTCSEENKSESDTSKGTTEETKMDTEANAVVSKEKTEESKTIEKSEVVDSAETKTTEPEAAETVNKEKPSEISADKDEKIKEVSLEEVKKDKDVPASDVTDKQVNGKSNGDSKTVNFNGDASKDEELSSRLSVENGKEAVNGSNGDSVEEQGQGDNKVEIGVSDIKVKSVATEEARSDPIEQPTEA